MCSSAGTPALFSARYSTALFSGPTRCPDVRRLGVQERPGHVVRAARHAVLEQDARDAERVEPGRDVLALVVPGQEAVAAARGDDGGGAGVLGLVGAVDGDRRLA